MSVPPAGILSFARCDKQRSRLAAALAVAGGAALSLGATGVAGAAVPEASDFSQALRGAERVGSAGDEGSAYRSGVIDAPAQFDLAGLAGELREVEMRARLEGGEWTDWAETV